MMTVLSLCDHSGAWSKPYRDAGYDVRMVDLKDGLDVRLFEALPYPVRGVLAAPPCTAFAISGAQYWKAKDRNGGLLEALSVVDACLRIVAVHQPAWWCLENPIGRLKKWIGEPRMAFDPRDYGDPYMKRTLLWGRFAAPMKVPVVAALGNDPIMRLGGGGGETTRELRSVTPGGFARAFFDANP